MEYTLMQLVWLFFIYSVIGWFIEISIAAIQKKKFINRGFVNGPYCPIYGFGVILFSLFLGELTDNLFFLFLGGMVLATVLEWSTGMLMEKIFRKKLWDYSHIKWNLDGYVCLRYSLIWGIWAVLIMLFLNPALCSLVSYVPHPAALTILWILSAILLLDFISTTMAVLKMQKAGSRMAQITEGLQETSRLLENALTRKIQSRMMKSFPSIDIDTLINNAAAKMKEAGQAAVFAQGCSFYKLVGLFFIGAFLGDITETIFCLITIGKLISRSSVVYGPFSIVWGLACALLTALLYRYKDKGNLHIFLAGVILGGAYEYICSIFTELVFGTVFWDYSRFTFNLGGRINLLYCVFWGFAAIIWFKAIYPFLSGLIEKLPVRFGIILSNCAIAFMIVNILISSLALMRYTERNTEPTTPQVVQEESAFIETLQNILDDQFPDQRMEAIYPNAIIVKNH